MASPFYTWWVGDLRTGRITAEVPVSDGTWQCVIDDAGSLQFVAAVNDPTVRGLALYNLAEPCRCFLAVSYTDDQGNETFLEAGPIWTHDYDSATGALTVSGAGLWSLFDHRKILPVLAAGVSPATVTTSYTSKSLGAVARGLVQLAMTHTGGDVPVNLPADEAGTWNLSYAGSAMTAVGQALRDIAAVDNGPEVQFRPRRSVTDHRYLQWDMLVGTIGQPLLVQAGDDVAFDQSAPRSQVLGVAVNRDGSKMADRWWTQGAGTDVSTLFGRADDATGLIAAGFPLLEGGDSRNDITDQPSLNTIAAGGLQRNARPVDTYTVTAHRDGAQGLDGPGSWLGPNAGTCRVGYWVSATVGGWRDPVTQTTLKEPYLAPLGDTRTIRGRISSIGGGMSEPKLAITLAPEVES